MKMIIATITLAISALVFAETLSDADAGLIAEAGFPIHPDAQFVFGNSSAGFRFATDTSVADVRNWYVEQLDGWTLTEDFGLWAIYDGPTGLSFSDRMRTNQLTVDVNEEMPGWYSLDESMTTEIVVQIGK